MLASSRNVSASRPCPPPPWRLPLVVVSGLAATLLGPPATSVSAVTDETANRYNLPVNSAVPCLTKIIGVN